MKKYPLSALVFDFTLYPRGGVDSHHVTEIETAIRAGASMPPLVVEKSSKRVVDGFHRWKALTRIHGEDFEIDCVEKVYKNDGELFLDSIRYNVSHGRALTQHDKAHCLLLAEKLRIDRATAGSVLCLTTERIGELTTNRVGTVSGAPIALKRTIRHMGGQELTPKQASANEKLSGMNQLFYVNQIITLIESDLLDTSNDDLMSGLAKLRDLLRNVLKKAA